MKTLWSEWDLLLFRNRVLCRKCESDGGDQIIDQVILPESLRQAALEAHHSHTTASHRGVRKTLGALQFSSVHRFVAWCHANVVFR